MGKAHARQGSPAPGHVLAPPGSVGDARGAGYALSPDGAGKHTRVPFRPARQPLRSMPPICDKWRGRGSVGL
jgi:hypothetical protein